MQIAQRLYEGVQIGGEQVGLITYMRTDGVQMAEEAYAAARSAIGRNYGKDYLPDGPRRYTSKAKNAQEAHEAMRPTDFDRRPGDVHLEPDMMRLYELVWKRAVASQMEAASLERTTVEIPSNDNKVVLRATGQVVKFDGFLTLYQEGQDEKDDEEGGRLPALREGDTPKLVSRRTHAALHRTAAALFGSLAGQEAGRTRHRPAVHLRLDALDADRPRLCAAGAEALLSGRQGPPGHHLPREILRAIRRVRFHRRSGRKARPRFRRQARVERPPSRLLEGVQRLDRARWPSYASPTSSTRSTKFSSRTSSRPSWTKPATSSIRASARRAAPASSR